MTEKAIFLHNILLKSIEKSCADFIFARNFFARGFQWCVECSEIKIIHFQPSGVLESVFFVPTSKKS